MFNFLHPGFLFALFAISIPLIIHLFHFRRFKKVWFSNTSFLQQIKTEKQSKNRLKHLLVLILRILAIISLVFAFAQPFIKNKNIILTSGNTAISIYIDNSFSMENKTSDNSLLEEAKKMAAEIIRGSGNNDQFQVLTNEFKIRQLRFYSKNDINQLVNEIEISPFIRDIRTVFLRQANSFDHVSASNKIIYIISDFQKISANFDKTNIDKKIITCLIPVKPEEAANLYIDSAWFESPIVRNNQQTELSVRITNLSDKPIEETNIRLNINEKEKALSNFTLAANQSLTIKIPFTISNSGWNRGKLYIDDYPVTFDDDYYFCFYIQPGVKILSINGNTPNSYFKTVYSTDDYFSFDEINLKDMNPLALKNYQFIILNEPEKITSGIITELEDFVNDGGNLLFIPSSVKNLTIGNYNSFLTRFGISYFSGINTVGTKVAEINTEHPLMKNVFEKKNENISYPLVKKYFEKATGIYSSEVTLIKLENDQPLLTTIGFGKGNIFTFSTPMNSDWTNFPLHALFVPLMYQLALFKSSGSTLAYFIGRSKNMTLNQFDSTGTTAFKLQIDNNSFIPDYKLVNGKFNVFTDEKFNKAGFYYVLPETLQKSGINHLNNYPVFAMNYDRQESVMSFYSTNELNVKAKEKGYNLFVKKANNIRYLVQNMDKGKPLWKLFIWLALSFLLAEVLILRFWKT